MKQRIIISLFLGLVLGLGLNSIVYAASEHGGEHIEESSSQVEHESDTEHNQPAEHHQSTHEETDAYGGHEEARDGGHQEAHGGGHQEAHGGGHGGGHGGHHIWWTFPGYEILLSIISCIYFALFIIVIGHYFGTDLEGHH